MAERLGCNESCLVVDSDDRGDEGHGFCGDSLPVVLVEAVVAPEGLLGKLGKDLQSGRDSSRWTYPCVYSLKSGHSEDCGGDATK